VSFEAWQAVLVRPLNAIKTWGYNSNGLLGDGNSANQQPDAKLATALRLPDAVQTIRAISTSGCNSHSMLLAGDGTVWSWGDNTFGELGVVGTNATDPIRVTGLPPVIAVAAGCYVSAALSADGTVWTWGYNNYGTLGDGTTANRTLPAQVPGLTAVAAISMRGLSLSALRTTGRVYTWGYNGYGELGAEAGASRSTVPASTAYLALPGGNVVRTIAQGPYNGFAILDDGTMAGWGSNSSGMLGVAGTASSYLPTLVGFSSTSPMRNVVSVSPGIISTLAIGNSHRTVLGWGSAYNAQLGNLAVGTYNTPQTMSTAGKVVSSGSYVSAVIHYEGDVRVVGNGGYGSLGSGDTLPRTAWTTATGVINATSVVTSQYFNMAIVPGPTRQREYAVVQCGPKTALLTSAGTLGNSCSITAPSGGASGTLLRGDVLAPDRVYRRGEVLVDAAGIIACVACDCSTTPGYAQATRIDCPNAAISPGMINTHEHLSCRGLDANPARFAIAPYSFRDDWSSRTSDPDGLTNLNYNCSDVTPAELTAAETRHIVSGTTSVVGHGSSTGSGLLRNLDVVDIAAMKRSGRDMREGLRTRVVSNTFPLDDRFMTAPADGACAGTQPVHIHGADAEILHLGEGIEGRADRELTCAVGGSVNGVYPDQTTVVHAIAIQPQQAKLLRDSRAWVSWSPRSNINLYGDTAPVMMLDHMGVGLALGTDWSVTGSISLNRELACATAYNQTYLDNYFSDYRLWQMVTTNAASAAGVERSVGQLRAGAIADIAIFDGSAGQLHTAVVRGDTRAVAMTMRGGDVLYGDPNFFTDSASPWYPKSGACGVIAVCGLNKRVCAAVGAFNPYLAYCGTGVEPSCTPRRTGYGPASATDRDGDGWLDVDDNCPTVFNPTRPIDGYFQADSEPTGADGIGDACDPCPLTAGVTCAPLDANDQDADGIANVADTCPGVSDGSADSDGDGIADACDCTLNYCVVDVALTRDQESLHYLADGDYAAVLDLYVTAIVPGLGYFAQVNPSRLPPVASGHMSDPGDAGNYGNLGIYVATAGTPMVDDWSLGTTEVLVVGSHVGAYGRLSGASGTRTLSDGGTVFHDRGTTLPFQPLQRFGSDLASYSVNGGNTSGLLAEAFESTWMTVTNTRLTNAYPDGQASTSNEFQVLFVNYDPTQWSNLRIDDLLTDYSGQLGVYRTPNRTFSSISGVLTYSDGNHKLAPRSTSEIVTP
jgi:alpha-tubulin suppressor-like RCC1 family protein